MNLSIILEWSSALLSLIAIYLAGRGKVINWPLGIVSVALMALVFAERRIWGQVGLQFVFIAFNIYGWYEWHKKKDAPFTPQVAGIRVLITWFFAGLAISSGLHSWLKEYPALSITRPDALITGFSMAAQVGLARKQIENWCFWVGIDVWAAYWFYTLGLTGFAILYAALALVALQALYRWEAIRRMQ